MTSEPTAGRFDTDVSACRGRQRKLLQAMQQHDLDLVIVHLAEHVQWLAGPRLSWVFSPCAALAADGKLTLVVPQKFREPAAADELVHYDAKWHSTLRNDQRTVSAGALARALSVRLKPRRVGVEFSACGPCMTGKFDAKFVDIEPTLYQLRRRKDADELARLEKAIAATGAMYCAAREIIAPGLNELEMFSRLQAAAVAECGERLTETGNDYASGQRGGPPRNRAIDAGELYILDLGPAFRGYFADNCRTLSVDSRPTDAQLRAHEAVRQVFATIEREVKPGKNCKELFQQAQEQLDGSRPWAFDHHLGHGIGLFPHEAPHLNPFWDDVFQQGEVFAVEPGLYGADLRQGIRLENDYLVTADGVRLLSDFPLEL